MSDIYVGELQNEQGIPIYPHTEADVVFCLDGESVQNKLERTEDVLGDVTGKTDYLEVSDSSILATSKATNALKKLVETVQSTANAVKTALAGKLNNSGTSTHSGTVDFRKTGVAPSATAYSAAPIVITTDYNNDADARPGMGFHLAGCTAGYLYLDNDGHLKFVRNSGKVENVTGLNGNLITYNASENAFYAQNYATGVKKKLGSGTPTMVHQHSSSWNNSVTLTVTVPAGNKFIVDEKYQKLTFDSGSTVTETASHSSGTVYTATADTTVTYIITTSGCRASLSLAVTYWEG